MANSSLTLKTVLTDCQAGANAASRAILKSTGKMPPTSDKGKWRQQRERKRMYESIKTDTDKIEADTMDVG